MKNSLKCFVIAMIGLIIAGLAFLIGRKWK